MDKTEMIKIDEAEEILQRRVNEATNRMTALVVEASFAYTPRLGKDVESHTKAFWRPYRKIWLHPEFFTPEDLAAFWNHWTFVAEFAVEKWDRLDAEAAAPACFVDAIRQQIQAFVDALACVKEAFRGFAPMPIPQTLAPMMIVP